VLAIYAELDDFVNPTMEAAEAALQEAGLEHELRTFEGVDHAFFNDTGRNYDADAAAEAYAALLEWFDAHLAAAARTDSTAPPTS
jgi:carboxymethylenebutenolidase